MHHLWSAHVASAGARSGFGSCTKWSLARRVTCLCGGPLQRCASVRPASASCPGIVSSWLHYWYPLSPIKGTGRGSRQAPKESNSSWAASLSTQGPSRYSRIVFRCSGPNASASGDARAPLQVRGLGRDGSTQAAPLWGSQVPPRAWVLKLPRLPPADLHLGLQSVTAGDPGLGFHGGPLWEPSAAC